MVEGSDGHTPVLYRESKGALTIHLDSGYLNGQHNNAKSDQIMADAAAAWNQIDTSSAALTLGPDLETPITAANYETESYNQIVNHGRSHVIYDNNGAIVDLLYGKGAKSSILGIGASYYYIGGEEFIGGYLILNGFVNISTTAYITTAMHELGHVMGLDHTQLDSSQGLTASEYPIMYPTANVSNPPTLWHEDDRSIISRLYPSASFESTYRLIQGYFVNGSGQAVLGANIWVENEATGELFSSVSDFLTQGTGYFAMAVPAGSYSVHAQSIRSGFTGGSSVGPYSETSGGASFQSPHPIVQQTAVKSGQSTLLLSVDSVCEPIVTFVLDGISSARCNRAPSVSGVSILPDAPTADDDLSLAYTYADADGDAESGTTIRWYKNREAMSVFDGSSTIPNGATQGDETWEVEVTPSDGRASGAPVRSAPVSIEGTGGSDSLTLDGDELAQDVTANTSAQAVDTARRCGCATSGGAGEALFLILALALVRRLGRQQHDRA